jgi:hypothetical protein
MEDVEAAIGEDDFAPIAAGRGSQGDASFEIKHAVLRVVGHDDKDGFRSRSTT